MPTRRRPGPIAQWMHIYLFHRAAEKEEKLDKESVAESLREHVREYGTVRTDDDGNELTGNIEFRLPGPIEALGKTYYGMELRKQPHIVFDYAAARKMAEDKGLKEEEYGHWEFIIDPDLFYVMNQRGQLTEDELDSLLVEQDPTYALWPLEKPE